MELVIVLAVGVLVARVGQCLYATGLSRAKNAAGMTARMLLDACLAALAFWAVGAAIVFQQRSPYFGIRVPLLFGWKLSGDAVGVVLLYMTAVLIGTGAVAGAMAERSRFAAASLSAILLGGLLMPAFAKWTSSGWLHNLGYIDLAGASAIHLTAGVCAACGAAMVGPRNGKYHRDGSASNIPGHSIPLAGAGAMLTFAGWVPYAAGFAMLSGHVPPASAALQALLAGAAGGVAAALFGKIRYGKVDVTLVMLGLLGALVAISACAGRVASPAAVAIGVVAGLLVPIGSIILDLRIRIDDPIGAVSIHGIGGLWGTIAAGVFAGGPTAVRLKLVGIQLLGAVAIIAISAVLSVALYGILKRTVGLRSREADEYDGLDLAEHDIGAYPDFQQTMIKSYHLREA